MRIFAIGDIHGHAKELQDLLLLLTEQCDFSLTKDHLVLCGDLVDAGPDTKEVLDWCIATRKQYPNTFHPLKGNHDDMMVDALLYNSKKYGDYYLWYMQGGKQTILSYFDADRSEYDKAISQPEAEIPEEHLHFLDNLPLYWWPDNSEYFFCHAGIPPAPLSEFDPDDPKTQEALLWIRSEFYNSDIDFGRKIIFGHTPFTDHTWMGEGEQYAPLVKENLIGINTMPRNEGHLTCVILPEEVFVTV